MKTHQPPGIERLLLVQLLRPSLLLCVIGWFASIARASQPAEVEIRYPMDGAVFDQQQSVSINATAIDPNPGGGILRVRFLVDGEILEARESDGVFRANWTNMVQGHFTITAEAEDLSGTISVSAPIAIRVLGPSDPPAVSAIEFVQNTHEGMTSDPAILAVLRNGSRAQALEVQYSVSGTATPGADYVALSGVVTIPAGETVAYIPVTPLGDRLEEDAETVQITLRESDHGGFTLGAPNSASVWIEDTPVPEPSLTLHRFPPSPEVTAGTNVLLRAVATGVDLDPVQRVEFYSDHQLLGTVKGPQAKNVYELVWQNVPAGRFGVRAVALLSSGSTNVAYLPELIVRQTPSDSVMTITAVAPEAGRAAIQNDGQFRIQRTGDWSRVQNVYFQVAGDAIAGVDYEPLGNFVTFSAGESSVSVFVTPRRTLNRPDSVQLILKLQALPESELGLSPEYEIGDPDTATVVIYVGPPVQPLNLAIEELDASRRLVVSGQENSEVIIDSSTDLSHWIPIVTNVVHQGTVLWSPPAPANSIKLFRARYR